ncbi:YaeQ family protein [Geomesophilobacter sediminis]|uniref:YaeQ family protein n=1 Tax=Geomesophilobacter sediminis TaxID=2798584 RepID=A0A8J7IZ18_9BACT|nr:YaeQ family protein [Geomesophilobacter sediminis]MBJ6723223.1 YaeQ family protein [Geomesophilobacter sediminis]
MALPSTVHRATVQLSDIDRGVYQSIQTTLARHPSETQERLVARLLAYLLFYEEDLQFTKGISAGDEPDLWSKGPDDRVLTWVEVGLPEPERLLKASRHAGRVALLPCGNGFPHWERQHLPKITGIGNLTLVTVDPGFLSRVAAQVERSIVWEVTITEGTLYLQSAGESLETEVVVRCGERG